MKNKNLQTEIDASYLYRQLAAHEEDEIIANVFRQMSEIEGGHVAAFAKKSNLSADQLPGPSWRARTFNLIGKVFGYDYVLGVLMDTEKSLSQAILSGKKNSNQHITGTETSHVRILRNILEQESEVTGGRLARFENGIVR